MGKGGGGDKFSLSLSTVILGLGTLNARMTNREAGGRRLLLHALMVVGEDVTFFALGMRFVAVGKGWDGERSGQGEGSQHQKRTHVVCSNY